MEALISTAFETWVIRTQVELAALTDAAARQDWTAAQVSIEALDSLLSARPEGEVAAIATLLTAAHKTIEEVHAMAADVRAVVATEIRQLGIGRKALKAYR